MDYPILETNPAVDRAMRRDADRWAISPFGRAAGRTEGDSGRVGLQHPMDGDANQHLERVAWFGPRWRETTALRARGLIRVRIGGQWDAMIWAGAWSYFLYSGDRAFYRWRWMLSNSLARLKTSSIRHGYSQPGSVRGWRLCIPDVYSRATPANPGLVKSTQARWLKGYDAMLLSTNCTTSGLQVVVYCALHLASDPNWKIRPGVEMNIQPFWNVEKDM
jgi:hypothetical protein